MNGWKGQRGTALAEFAVVRHEPVQPEVWEALSQGHPTEV